MMAEAGLASEKGNVLRDRRVPLPSVSGPIQRESARRKRKHKQEGI